MESSAVSMALQECRLVVSRLLEGIEGLESLEFCMLLARTGSEIANIGGNPGGNVEVSEEQGQAVLHQMRMHNTEIRKDFAGLQSRLDAAEKVLEQHVDDGRSAADALQEAKDALASRSIEVDFLEQDLAHASEQISALSDQVWLQVDAAEMHRQLDSTNSRVGELEAWLASREEGLHQAEIRSAQMAQLNDRLSERVQELEMMGMGDGQNSARAPQTSAWLEQRDDTIERLHMDVEKLRKTIVAKEMDAKSAQARADACKQAMEKARQLWKGSEDQLRRELRASMKEAMQAKELCHNAKVEVENLRKRQEAASSLGGVDEGEPGVFQKHCSVHSTAQQAPHRPSDRVRGEDVTQLAALERKICLMGEQRKLEQEAVMMHMESSEEELQRMKNEIAREKLARGKAESNMKYLQMELEILHQQIAVRKQVEAEHALSLQPSPEHSPTILEPISPGSVLSNLLTGLLSPSPRPSADRSPALCSPRVNLSPASPTKIYKIPAPALETIEETHKETDGSPRDADGHVSHPNQGTNKAAVKQPPLQRNPRKVEGMQHVLGVHMQIGTPNSPDWRVTL